ncbi:MAG TPA: four-carbon acid sugar kinase family protein, partial [Paracoccaceae bacterium]|nr:four-carbon acid sugar kinase family protein [Paracoccaceae bacterium]
AEMTGAETTLFCPSYPEVGRTVYQGHLFVSDQLVSDSPKRFDPLTPMPDPNLVGVLGRQTRARVGLVPHAVLASGRRAAEAHIQALLADGVRYLIFDAVDDEDVAACARLTADWPAMTGGDTLSHMAPALRVPDRRPAPPLPRIGGPAAVIAGSCGAATLEQLDIFAGQHPVRRIDLVAAAGDPDAAIADALDWAVARLGGGPVALAVSDRPEGVARSQAALGRAEAARLGESICARLAAGLHAAGVRRFVVAGGETSGAVAAALRIEKLDAAPSGALGGGLCHAAAPTPMGLFFKAGKMGPPDLFLRAFAMMEGTG